MKTLSGHSGVIRSIKFSPDGNILASGSGDSSIILWDCNMNNKIHTMNNHSGYVYSVAFSPDDKIVASAGADKSVIL